MLPVNDVHENNIPKLSVIIFQRCFSLDVGRQTTRTRGHVSGKRKSTLYSIKKIITFLYEFSTLHVLFAL